MSESNPRSAERWPWPDSLDALAAAPRHHELLLENDRVRVLYTRIPAGDLVPLHTHRWQGVVHLLSWSHFVRRDQHGKVLLDSRQMPSPPQAPSVQWLDPLPPHTVENVGESEILLFIVELKPAERSR
ncbi:MAG TPA: hypothetical protein VLV49_16200 [Terriglobales bacterium]|nr:hypothetical protein [Terriglobales bacterium]